MSRGILLCAHDSDLFWYGRMAYCCSLMIRGHMGDHDIRLMTDERTWSRLISEFPDAEEMMEPIIVERPILDTSNRRTFLVGTEIVIGEYYNITRPSVYDLSPFDETLVIDVDMLIFDDRLNLVWGSEDQFMMNNELSSMVFPNTFDKFQKRLDDASILIYWATVFYFKKTPEVESFFRVVGYVRDNYKYYSELYLYPRGLYRNDYTFSVAAHIMNGHLGGINTFVVPLPVPYLTFAWEKDYIMSVDRGSAIFRVHGHDPSISRVRGNVHCMNKSSYEQFTGRIIELYA